MPGNPFYQSAFWLALKAEALKRDGYRCTVPGCPCSRARGDRMLVDHIVARPRGVTTPTPQDVLSNLRVLCVTHDNQAKEDAAGQRRSGGAFVVRGCDADGWPLDPGRR